MATESNKEKSVQKSDNKAKALGSWLVKGIQNSLQQRANPKKSSEEEESKKSPEMQQMEAYSRLMAQFYLFVLNKGIEAYDRRQAKKAELKDGQTLDNVGKGATRGGPTQDKTTQGPTSDAPKKDDVGKGVTHGGPSEDDVGKGVTRGGPSEDDVGKGMTHGGPTEESSFDSPSEASLTAFTSQGVEDALTQDNTPTSTSTSTNSPTPEPEPDESTNLTAR